MNTIEPTLFVQHPDGSYSEYRKPAIEAGSSKESMLSRGIQRELIIAAWQCFACSGTGHVFISDHKGGSVCMTCQACHSWREFLRAHRVGWGPTMSLDTPPGAKVVYEHGLNGEDYDVKEQRNFLTLGREYTVEMVDVGHSSSKVFLREIPRRGFNTVLFAPSSSSETGLKP